MENLQYNIHKILWSKYKLLINVLVLSLIYISFYGQQITLCMTEGDVPALAETKSISSHQTLALKREIIDYAQLHRPVGDVFELERIRVHEKIIAYTNVEPEKLLDNLETRKQIILTQPTNRLTQEQLDLPYSEKNALFHSTQISRTLGGTTRQCQLSPILNIDNADRNKVYYLLRLYRRLNILSR